MGWETRGKLPLRCDTQRNPNHPKTLMPSGFKGITGNADTHSEIGFFELLSGRSEVQIPSSTHKAVKIGCLFLSQKSYFSILKKCWFWEIDQFLAMWVSHFAKLKVGVKIASAGNLYPTLILFPKIKTIGTCVQQNRLIYWRIYGIGRKTTRRDSTQTNGLAAVNIKLGGFVAWDIAIKRKFIHETWAGDVLYAIKNIRLHFPSNQYFIMWKYILTMPLTDILAMDLR